MTHSEYVFSWKREYDNEGDRDREATEEDTQTYCFGIMPDELINIPHPVADPIQRWVYSSWDMDSQGQGALTIPHSFNFYLVNGIELYYALGDCTNSAPSYKQHICEGIDSGHLPTRTFHYEAKGGGTDVLLDFTGRKTVALTLTCRLEGFLTAEVTTVGARGASGGKNAIYGVGCGTASEDAVEYSNAPIFPPTANVEQYMMNADYACTWDTDAQNALKELKIMVATPCETIWDNTETVDEYGIAQKRWPLSNWEKGKRIIAASWIVEQDDPVAFEDMLDAVTNKSLDITWERGTNDNILFELDQCQITTHKIQMPWVKSSGLYEILILPETMKATVQDTINHAAAPGFYSEDVP